MNHSLRTKLRLVYFPYLLLCIGIVCLYTFLNWLLFIRLQLFVIKEETRDLWIPAALPWVPLIIWYRPRLRLLKYRKKARDPIFAMIFLAGFIPIIPLVIAQAYLNTAAGKLSDLNDVKEMAKISDSRYYRIKDYSIDREYTRTHLKRKVSGKYNQNLELSLYIACPFYDNGMVPRADNRHYPISDDRRLYFLNGSLSDSLAIMKIPPDRIANREVVKGAAALAKYGLAGKNGVVLITSLDPDSMKALGATSVLPDSGMSRSQGESGTTKITGTELDSSFYPLAWIGVKYHKQISNRLDDDTKLRQIKEFIDESWLDYVQRPVKHFSYFDEISYDDDYTEYQKAVSTSRRVHPGERLRLLIAQNEPFEKRNGSKLPWIFGSLAIGAALYFLILLFIPVDEDKVKAFLAGHGTHAHAASEKEPASGSGWKAILPAFVLRKEYAVTMVIIFLNLTVFIAMVIAGLGFIEFTAADLASWGGNYGPYTSDGQWWRLLTSIFLHVGLMHLALNMYALLFVGIFLEPLLGRNRFAICYLVTGILASLASYKVHPNVVAVGASGAIFGMYGIFLAFLLTGAFPPAMKKVFLASTLIFIGYNLLMGLAGNVDNAAHLGGLVAGFVIGLMLSGKVKGMREDVEHL
ncbi:MAG TPA: rhomboid family intramembrane serine protease [Puia sp.]|nr:rhomboid family intramembrane serine protease [Puia sp.]